MNYESALWFFFMLVLEDTLCKTHPKIHLLLGNFSWITFVLIFLCLSANHTHLLSVKSHTYTICPHAAVLSLTARLWFQLWSFAFRAACPTEEPLCFYITVTRLHQTIEALWNKILVFIKISQKVNCLFKMALLYNQEPPFIDSGHLFSICESRIYSWQTCLKPSGGPHEGLINLLARACDYWLKLVNWNAEE